MGLSTYLDTGDRVVVRDSQSNNRRLTLIVNDDCLELELETAKKVYEGLLEALVQRGVLDRDSGRSR
jgi:hypothetical protein